MRLQATLIVPVFAVLSGCASTALEEPSPASAGVQAAAPPAQAAAASSQVAPVRAVRAQGDAAGPAAAARIVYFEYDSHAIRPQFQELLEAHAGYLRANPARRVVIQGHTDERGGREYNLALGQRRSESVVRAFRLLGVDDARIEATSFGEEKTAVAGGDEAAWSQNRRAEIVYR